MEAEIISNNTVKKVSVITVTRNLIKCGRQNYFEQMCDSVRSQTYPAIEHVIIDGASTDGTVEMIISKMTGHENVVFLSEPDTGLFNAMNKGISHSTGDYIAFMNSDDYYYCDQALEWLVEAIEADEADYSTSDWINIKDNGQQIRSRNRHSIGHNTVLCKRELLEHCNGFDERFPFAADYDWILKITLDDAKRIHVNKPLTTFRLGGTSTANRAALRSENTEILKHILGPYLPVRIIEQIDKKEVTWVTFWKIHRSKLSRQMKMKLYSLVGLRRFIICSGVYRKLTNFIG